MKMSKDMDGRSRASELLSKHGYGKIKSIADKEVKKGVHEHEEHEHKGKKTKLKFADGGHAKGAESKHRVDRKARAAGGRTKHKEPKIAVNVINAGGGKQAAPMMPMGGGSAPMPPHPMPAPMSPAPAAAPPMAARPPMPAPGGMPPQRPFKKGGPVRSKMDIPHLEGGAGGGLGRLEKAAHEKKRK